MHFLIIGVGSIGERHLRNFLRIEGVRCSIAEINAELRKKIASEYEVQASYADYLDADLSSFDGVVICTPANTHIPMATDIVAAGTHVLTEKPLAMSLEGVDELIKLRDKKSVVVSVAFILRCDPVIAETREQSLDRMIAQAQANGANAIIGVRFGTSEVMDGAAEILVYGTAVVLADE